MQVRSDRRYPFPVSRAEVWTALTGVRDYPSWWPWLADFDGTELVAGARWRCRVEPPLPYHLDMVVVLDEVVAAQHLAAHVEGDVQGQATVDLLDGADPGASVVVLRSQLGPGPRWLQTLAVVARPVVRRGHDWVLDTGARQFGAALGAAEGHG